MTLKFSGKNADNLVSVQNVEEAFKRAARHIHANFLANKADSSNRAGLMSDTGRATIIPTSTDGQSTSARNCCVIA